MSTVYILFDIISIFGTVIMCDWKVLCNTWTNEFQHERNCKILDDRRFPFKHPKFPNALRSMPGI